MKEAETGVVTTSQGIPGAARRWKRQGRIHLDFGLLASSTVKVYISFVLCHPVHGTLL